MKSLSNEEPTARQQWKEAWHLARVCADKLDWQTVAGDVWWIPHTEIMAMAWACHSARSAPPKVRVRVRVPMHVRNGILVGHAGKPITSQDVAKLQDDES